MHVPYADIAVTLVAPIGCSDAGGRGSVRIGWSGC